MTEPAKTGVATQQAQNTNLAINQASLTDMVASKINSWVSNGDIILPKDYDINNAMKFAYLKLQTTKDLNNKPLFVDGKLDESVGTKNSVINALLTMSVQGLNVGKEQGYFIIFARQVTFMRSYFGTEAVTKMVQSKIGSFESAVIREGDTITYEMKYGKIMDLVHKTSWDNRSKPITGAYCVALDILGQPFDIELMSIEEIHNSWKQSKNPPFDGSGKLKPESQHAKFPVEFCKRTVINRLCKPIFNTSNDKQLLADMINKSEDLADRAMVDEDVAQLANTGPILEITSEAETPRVEELAGTEVEKGEAIPPEEPTKEEPKEEVTANPTTFDLHRQALEVCLDFGGLNNILKGIREDSNLTDEEKKALDDVRVAAVDRLKKPQPEKDEAPKAATTKGPGF
jgi:recombination protein RecT